MHNWVVGWGLNLGVFLMQLLVTGRKVYYTPISIYALVTQNKSLNYPTGWFGDQRPDLLTHKLLKNVHKINIQIGNYGD